MKEDEKCKLPLDGHSGYVSDKPYPSGMPYVRSIATYKSKQEFLSGKAPLKIIAISKVYPLDETIPRAPKPAVNTLAGNVHIPLNWDYETVPLSEFITGLQEKFGFGKAEFIRKPLRSVMNNKNVVHQDNLAVVTKQKKGQYVISPTDGLILPTPITFHYGNPDECISGVSLESLLAICKDQLIAHNEGESSCSENSIAIECCTAALTALRLRAERCNAEHNSNTQEQS